jgi:hypothetical protein
MPCTHYLNFEHHLLLYIMEKNTCHLIVSLITNYLRYVITHNGNIRTGQMCEVVLGIKTRRMICLGQNIDEFHTFHTIYDKSGDIL